ncbi:hypothetical protein FPV67DRAFT_1651470 [Lyophyllum atratum]|nr:hypothetical protein FPV67DRAFT_1651470 [Lyophyllum atratum]
MPAIALPALSNTDHVSLPPVASDPPTRQDVAHAGRLCTDLMFGNARGKISDEDMALGSIYQHRILTEATGAPEWLDDALDRLVNRTVVAAPNNRPAPLALALRDAVNQALGTPAERADELDRAFNRALGNADERAAAMDRAVANGITRALGNADDAELDRAVNQALGTPAERADELDRAFNRALGNADERAAAMDRAVANGITRALGNADERAASLDRAIDRALRPLKEDIAAIRRLSAISYNITCATGNTDPLEVVPFINGDDPTIPPHNLPPLTSPGAHQQKNT